MRYNVNMNFIYIAGYSILFFWIEIITPFLSQIFLHF